MLAEPRNRYCRDQAAADLLYFLACYFPHTFSQPFSVEQRFVVRQLQTAVQLKTLAAMVLPRGGGTTTIASYACLWAVCAGAARFPLFVADNLMSAEAALQQLRYELRENQRLHEDWPELRPASAKSYAARNLIALPTAAIRAQSMLGSWRGITHRLADNTCIRPDLLVFDCVLGLDCGAIRPGTQDHMLHQTIRYTSALGSAAVIVLDNVES